MKFDRNIIQATFTVAIFLVDGVSYWDRIMDSFLLLKYYAIYIYQFQDSWRRDELCPNITTDKANMVG